MTNALNETKPVLSKEELQKINRRRWSDYASRLCKVTNSDKLGYRALMILMGSINAQQRWLRITREEFKEHFPRWTENHANGDWNIEKTTPNGVITVKLHAYRDPKTNIFYFSQLKTRDDNTLIIKGWHVAALNGVRSRGIVMTQALSDELYKIGLLIVKSIREHEGVWRKVNNPMLETSNSKAEL